MQVVPQEADATMNVPHPLSPPPGSFDIPFHGKFFLDLFAGKNAPIFNACQLLRVDVLTPLELELGWDILDDINYERILHAAWNGFIGGMWSAPPCREYSRLKLKQPGPKPLRTPQEPTGRSDLTHQEQLRLQTQETIHDRGRTLLTAAHSKGALVGWETPPSAMTLLLTDNTEMLRDWNASCSHVAACHWGMNFSKSWLLCSNDADISSLASWCTCSHRHPSFAGLRTPSGGYVSSLTAEYPSALAMAIAQIMTKKCSFTGQILPATGVFSREQPPPIRQAVNDGGGFPSSANWTVNYHQDRFASLREDLWHFGQHNGLVEKVRNHLQTQNSEPPLAEEDLNPLKQIVHNWMSSQGFTPSWAIAPGQRFRLNLLQNLAALVNDPDKDLHYHLQQGVPTGVLEPIPPGHIWPSKPSAEISSEPLQSFDSNWAGAEEDPDLTWSLLQAELEEGWIEEIPGGIPEAKQRWTSIAVGKLNVVQAIGRKPRLVLDSSCCKVNQNCTLPETMILPTIDDVRATVDLKDTGGTWSALSLDIKAAHKQIRLLESNRGLVLFQFQSRLFGYKVAHFGGRFSAFWWARLGALLLRLLHQFLEAPHNAWLYVDDLMLWAPNSRFDEAVWSTIIFLMLLGTPISWNKAQMGTEIIWIGWAFNLQFYNVQMVPDKVSRLQEIIRDILSSKVVSHKMLEKVLGMLIWFTSVAKFLRPHLAPIYKNLYCPPATLFSIPAASWTSFLDTLDSSGTIVKSHPHFALPLTGRVVEVGHTAVQDKFDIPVTPKTSKLQWVRIAGPGQSQISLSTEAKKKLRWFLSLMHRQVHIYPLAQPKPSILRAAADAFAENESFGIGGWIISSSQVVWFSEQFNMSDLRLHRPDLKKDAQKYISAFEVLAQLALLMTASSCLLCDQMEICIPASSDNTSAESSINRQLSTKEPTATFLQLISQWAFQHHMSLSISHIAGHDNVWADNLSRNRCQQWHHYPRKRFDLQAFFSIGRTVKLFPPGDHPEWLQALTIPVN